MLAWLENAMDFSGTLNTSIAASWLILVVIVLRFLLRRAPKWVNVALWGIVALRILMPFSVESSFSLMPSAETVSDQILTAEPSANYRPAYLEIVTNPTFGQPVTLTLDKSMDSFQWDLLALNVVWLAGMALMGAYALITYLSLRRKLRNAVLLRDNIFRCDAVPSPFVLGIIKPKIYLPFSVNDQDMDHVIAHELAHISRKDHWWKPLGFLLLSIHWFNPLMWLAYILMCRDIELACDEKVIKKLDSAHRADYTQALVSCSVSHQRIAACPLAFGEIGVKERVKSILNYRKPGFWFVLAAVIICLIVAACFLTDPVSQHASVAYTVSSYLRQGDQVEVRKAYNRENSSLSVTLTLDSTSGPLEVEIIYGYANNGESEWVYYDPVHLRLGESMNFTVPSDSHFTVSAIPVEGQSGNVTFGFTETSHAGNTSSTVTKWFDYTDDPSGMSYENELKIQLDAFPDITFKYTPLEIVATDSWEDGAGAGKTILISGMPIWSAYFCDLTGDGLPEICAEASFGSGIIDNRVLIYDYAAGVSYKLDERGFYDYYLRMENDCLYVDKKMYNTDTLVSTGRLIYENGCIQIQQVKSETSSVLLAKILEIREGYYLVAPVEGSWELSVADRIEVPMQNMSPSPEPMVGDILQIEYSGEIQETYPARITQVYHISLQRTYTDASVMIPTDTQLEGFHAGALLVPVNGAIYRYSLTSPDPEGVSADELLFSFTETDMHRSIDWEIYSLKEYPYFTAVLAASATNGTWLCTYNPPERCSESALDNAIEANCAVLKDGLATHGQNTWQEFFDQVRQGNPASVAVAHYYTLDPQRCSREYYEVFSQDYPSMQLYQLAYDGNIFTLSRLEDNYVSVKTYEYLLVYDATDFYAASSQVPQERYEYVLTHDNMVTREQLWNGLTSSQADAYIDHFTIYLGEKPRTP